MSRIRSPAAEPAVGDPRLAGCRVAVLNWRDPWHPHAGGAEVYAWQAARALRDRGARVVYVTARAPGQARRSVHEGVEFRRMGGRWTLYPLVLLWLAARRRSFDAVLDCQNGIPFFAPWVVRRRTRVVCVVHHVHDAQFGVHFPAWLAAVGRFLEGPVARWTYRRHVVAAVSPSTVTALRERLRWRGPVVVVPNGAPRPVGHGGRRAAEPVLVCLGRLVPHKRVERVVLLAEALRVRVHVIGRGPDEARLRSLVAERGLDDMVRLHGYLAEEDKRRLLAEAWLHVTATQGEGWGLSVVEAAALGVPTVGFDVDGIRDAVRPGRTGWLVPPEAELAGGVDAALRELADEESAARYAEACRRWAGRFTWERTGAELAALVAGLEVPDREEAGR